MPRIARKKLESTFFHIIVQGINREYIFKTEVLMKRYLQLLYENSQCNAFKIIAYCIMNNHAHILINTENIEEMSKIMHKINTSFAKFYNKINSRVGYVFRDRFLSQTILNETQLFACIAYIHNNPIKANLVEYPYQYKYSSYNNYINKNGIVDDVVLSITFGNGKEYMEQFREIHKIFENEEFKDVIDNYETYEEVLKRYEKIDIEKDNNILKRFIIETKEKTGLSYYEISKRLNINKYKIYSILKIDLNS